MLRVLFNNKILDFNEHFLNCTSPIEFIIRANHSDYFDLNSVRLHGKFKIVKNNGDDIEAATDFSVCNHFPHALFKQVDV